MWVRMVVVIIVAVAMIIIGVSMIIFLSSLVRMIGIIIVSMIGLFLHFFFIMRVRIGIGTSCQVKKGETKNKEETFHFPEIKSEGIQNWGIRRYSKSEVYSGKYRRPSIGNVF